MGDAIELVCQLNDANAKATLKLTGFTKVCTEYESCTPGPGYNCDNDSDRCTAHEKKDAFVTIEDVSCKGNKFESGNFHDIKRIEVTLNCNGVAQTHTRDSLTIGYGDITSKMKYVLTGNCTHGEGQLQSESGNKIGAAVKW